MRNLSKLIFQRVVAVSVGIALQIIFLIVTATYLRADFFWIRIAMNCAQLGGRHLYHLVRGQPKL